MSRGLLSASELAGTRTTVEANFDTTGTRRRFPLVADRFNNQTRNTAAPSDLAIAAMSITQLDAREVTDERDEQAADWLGRFPSGTDITGRDQIITGGRTYEVVGPPEEMGTHLHAKLKFVEG